MSLINSIFGRPEPVQQPKPRPNFPRAKYSPARAIPVHRDELDALAHLLESEQSTPEVLDDFPWLQEIIDEQLESVSGVSHTDDIESQRADIRELIETWGQQINGDVGAVYCSVATRFRLHFYLYHCELRAENEEDEFELPESIEKIQTLYERVESAENGDEPIAIIHKDHLPFEEAEDVEDQ